MLAMFPTEFPVIELPLGRGSISIVKREKGVRLRSEGLGRSLKKVLIDEDDGDSRRRRGLLN